MPDRLRAALRAALLTILLPGAAAALAQSSGPAVHYKADPAHSELRFSFIQAGARNEGRFGKFTADVRFSAQSPSSIDVVVDVASIDTGDQERDETLRSAGLFDAARFPQAHFSATRIAPAGNGAYRARGKLTIRDVTRELELPFTLRTAREQGRDVGYMSGRVTIKRLDYGVGQGEWHSTEWVGNDVTVSFSLRLLPAG